MKMKLIVLRYCCLQFYVIRTDTDWPIADESLTHRLPGSII